MRPGHTLQGAGRIAKKGGDLVARAEQDADVPTPEARDHLTFVVPRITGAVERQDRRSAIENVADEDPAADLQPAWQGGTPQREPCVRVDIRDDQTLTPRLAREVRRQRFGGRITGRPTNQDIVTHRQPLMMGV